MIDTQSPQSSQRISNNSGDQQNSNTNSKKQSSFAIIFALANSMIGSSEFILPLCFKEAGIFSALIITVVLCYVCHRTCQMYVKHLRPNEDCIEDIVRRVLGRNWEIFYYFTTAIITFFVAMILFIIMANMLYPSIEIIFGWANSENYAELDEITFNKMSFQYCALISTIIFFLLAQVRDTSVIVKFLKYAFVCITLFVIFTIFIMVDNTARGRLSENNGDKFQFFTTKIAHTTGTFALAYMSHTTAFPIIKEHKYPEKVQRDLSVSYIITGAIYYAVGLMGYVGIYNQDKGTINTIMDVFHTKDFYLGIPAFIIDFSFFIKQVFTIPILFTVSKTCDEFIKL